MTYDGIAGVDLTTLFKSCVKTIRTRNKAMGVTLPNSKVFPSSSDTLQLYSRARDIQTIITNHHSLLCDHKKKYLLDSTNNPVSELEKNNMEKVITTNIKIIEDKIKVFDSDVRNISKEFNYGPQATECFQNLAQIIRCNLQNINFTFRELKELRKDRQKLKDKLLRLHRPVLSKKNDRPPHGENNVKERKSLNVIENNDKRNRNVSGSSDKENMSSKPEEKIAESPTKEKSLAQTTDYLESEMSGLLEDLSPEEHQLLQQENAHLYQELRSNQEEVRQITRQVVELGKMQDILTENVEIQAHQIEEIQDTIMSATENVQEGNEQVREAMRKDAGFRVWIMFFLIVMSFTLLFLDWYNA